MIVAGFVPGGKRRMRSDEARVRNHFYAHANVALFFGNHTRGTTYPSTRDGAASIRYCPRNSAREALDRYGERSTARCTIMASLEAQNIGDAWKQAASAAMDRYAGGDDAAFSELYDLLAPRLFAFLLRRTRDASHSEDLLQQTFLQMHNARRHFGTGADVTPWAYAIARRLLIDAFRKNRRECACVNEGLDEERESMAPSASPEAILGRLQLTERVERELARVPEAQRVAFELIQCDGLSMVEAAEVLGTTVTAVKLRAHRTYLALRAALGDDVREELRESDLSYSLAQGLLSANY
jgi:RNA polymerase sigma-70 factor (ECF subfamily)